MHKKIGFIFCIILVISLPIMMLLTDLQLVTFDLEFFEDKYHEYDIPSETGIEKKDLMFITEELLEYLKGNRDDIIIYKNVYGEKEQIFEERELLHLEDVKELFKKGFIIRNLTFLAFIISILYFLKYNRKKLPKALIVTSLLPIALFTILSILLALDFNKYFTYFHKILFDNDLWLLNPKTDILIQMYPLQFFYSIAYKIVAYFGIQLFITLIIGITLHRKGLNKGRS